MSFSLDKINPKFRELTDLFLFTDREDLDLTNFKKFLKENYNEHLKYFEEYFIRSCDIFWENGESFWTSRLTFLLSLEEKNVTKIIETHLEKRMVNIARVKYEIDTKYDIQFLQFVVLCKVKANRGESLASVKNYLSDMPSHFKSDKLINIVNTFIPFVFKDMNEFVSLITKKVTHSSRNFDLLKALEKKGVSFEREPLAELAKELVLMRSHSPKNRRTFFALLSDSIIFASIKKIYDKDFKSKLIDLLRVCEYREIEEEHLRNFKNIMALDSSLADELTFIYADKLYMRHTSHKKANIDRLIRLIKTIPEVKAKKVLVHLSNNGKMNDIKYLLEAFPDLNKLAAFV
jgi:hypothetical protein